MRRVGLDTQTPSAANAATPHAAATAHYLGGRALSAFRRNALLRQMQQQLERLPVAERAGLELVGLDCHFCYVAELAAEADHNQLDDSRVCELLAADSLSGPVQRLAPQGWQLAVERAVLAQSDSAQSDVAERAVDDAERAVVETELAALRFVVPRLGTISPWSSKASDIFAHAGLLTVKRIERARLLRLRFVHTAADDTTKTSATDATAVDLALSSLTASAMQAACDRMVETVLDELVSLDQLFAAQPPAELSSIALGDAPREALAAANTE